MGHKNNYSEAYKCEAVTKAKASGNVSQTARELDISNKSLHTWIQAVRRAGGWKEQK